MDGFPEWAGRQVLAQALGAVGLPWVPWAWYRRPRDAMTYEQRHQAIAMVGRVLAEARLRLPPGVCGSTLDREWRDAAWRCVVAGLALLDDQAREQLVGRGDDGQELPIVAADPVVIRRRVAEAPAVKPAVSLLFRRRGEVARAS